MSRIKTAKGFALICSNTRYLVHSLALNGAGPDKVVELFKSLRLDPADKADVFAELDRKEGERVEGSTAWHALLRTTRNTPEFGRALFATFR
jgi:hypothetical protein